MVLGGVYYLVFRLNQRFDAWMLHGQGISLLFLPAGVKHVAILVARGWGALGCFVALSVLAFEFWPEVSASKVVAYSALSTAATWTGLELGMRFLRVKRDLSNLRFMHFPFLDLVTTALHGFLVSAYFMAVNMKGDRFVENALAMMLGDYVGSLVMLLGFWTFLMLTKPRLSQP